MENGIELKNISFSYDANNFVDNFNFTADKKLFIGLAGVNGSGKSTILKLAAGILKPNFGEVNVLGRPISSYKGKERAKLVSYLPQTLNLNVPLKVKELISMGLYHRNDKYGHNRGGGMSVDKALEITGLESKKNSFMDELSGGEKKRACIAMTLIQGADIFLMDEPLANLDVKYQIELLSLLRTLKEERGMTIIMALHDINMMFRFDILHVINKGKLVASGPPKEIITAGLLEKTFGIDVESFKETYHFTLTG